MEKSKSVIRTRITTATVVLLRLIIGVTFIISGWAKATDPWGTVYKISEYLDVWDMDIPRALVTSVTFLLSAWEFVWGALLLAGTYRRVSVIALLLCMAGMLPLSLYIAVASPVADCGCFGDLFKISNTATFVKNIFLTAALVYLLVANTRVRPIFTKHTQWIVGGLLTFYILIIALIGYNIQPLVDFRRFSPGTSLLAVTDEDNDNDEDTEYTFIYTRDGVTRSFTADDLPDSTWTFVDRRLQSGSESVDDGLTVTVDGTDIMPDIIAPDGETPLPEQFIVTLPQPDEVDLSFTNVINDLNDYITERGGTLTAFIAGDSAAIARWNDIAMASYDTYRVEPNLIKELARGTSALVYLRDGTVVWKRTLSSVDTSVIGRHTATRLGETLDPSPRLMLRYINGGLIIILILLWLFDLLLPGEKATDENDGPAASNQNEPDKAEKPEK
ncbi:MAG: DoxX family protein [Duncaniella sp.]|nr:DoxX family protein [Duncaniella sp.]